MTTTSPDALPPESVPPDAVPPLAPAAPTPRAAARSAVVAACHRLAAAGLLIGTAGNVSVRVAGSDEVAITATGAVLGEITPEQVTIVGPGGEVRDGTLAPTSEAALHLGVLAAAPDGAVGAVVHTHSPVATSLGLVLAELPVVHYAQLALGGTLRVAPFHTFGSPELAAAVGAALDGRLAALMANHGAVALGADLAGAVENALLVEWLCDVYWRAAAIGTPRSLTDQEQHDVVAYARRVGYGSTRGASA